MSEETLALNPQVSNKTAEREQEGWARSVSVPDNAVPTCSSFFSSYQFFVNDFRGPVSSTNGQNPAHLDRTFVEWETSPAQDGADTVFTWIGGSQVRPASPG